MAKAKETILELDLQALSKNYAYLKSKIPSTTKFLAVVKAFAYGSDAEIIALHLQELKVDYFAVAYTQEGIALRNAGIEQPILVLHPQPVNFSALIAYNLEPSIYSFRVLKKFKKAVKKSGVKKYPIHIKYNSGLNRLGFSFSEIDLLITEIKNKRKIYVASLFSHLSASEDANQREFTLQQIEDFKTVAERISNEIGYTPILHQSNTSAILNYSESYFTMVRSGIGLYGFGNSSKEDKNLKPIGTLKSVISQIHTLQKGDSLGYNRAFIASKKTQTATIPIGHADGIARSYGNGVGFVYINNQKATIVGNVCMDMIMVNVTNINCKEGDEVLIFGNKHTAESLAKTIDSISYEALTSVSQRIKRVVKR